MLNFPVLNLPDLNPDSPLDTNVGLAAGAFLSFLSQTFLPWVKRQVQPRDWILRSRRVLLWMQCINSGMTLDFFHDGNVWIRHGSKPKTVTVYMRRPWLRAARDAGWEKDFKNFRWFMNYRQVFNIKTFSGRGKKMQKNWKNIKQNETKFQGTESEPSRANGVQ